jgi:hypothetical protein
MEPGCIAAVPMQNVFALLGTQMEFEGNKRAPAVAQMIAIAGTSKLGRKAAKQM